MLLESYSEIHLRNSRNSRNAFEDFLFSLQRTRNFHDYNFRKWNWFDLHNRNETLMIHFRRGHKRFMVIWLWTRRDTAEPFRLRRRIKLQFAWNFVFFQATLGAKTWMQLKDVFEWASSRDEKNSNSSRGISICYSEWQVE